MPTRLTRILATPVLVSLLMVLAPPSVVLAEGERHEIRGKVISYDGITPAEGITVSLVHGSTGKIYRSRPSDSAGEYRIPKVPDGDFTIRISYGDTTFDLPNPVTIGGGQPGAITVILPEAIPEEQQAVPEEKRRRRKAAWIAFPVAGGILLAAILLGGDGDGDQDKDGSPSTP